MVMGRRDCVLKCRAQSRQDYVRAVIHNGSQIDTDFWRTGVRVGPQPNTEWELIDQEG